MARTETTLRHERGCVKEPDARRNAQRRPISRATVTSTRATRPATTAPVFAFRQPRSDAVPRSLRRSARLTGRPLTRDLGLARSTHDPGVPPGPWAEPLAATGPAAAQLPACDGQESLGS